MTPERGRWRSETRSEAAPQPPTANHQAVTQTQEEFEHSVRLVNMALGQMGTLLEMLRQHIPFILQEGFRR